MPISPASAIASIVTVSVAPGPAISSSRWTLPAVKKSSFPVVIPIDIRSVTVPPATRSRPTRSIVRCISQQARRRALRVVGAVEQEQQRVAAPLEQAGTPVVGLVEQRREHAVERVAHELRADLALPREPLGERREARDVDEHQRSVDREVACVRRLPQPLDQESWNVRLELLARRLRSIGRSLERAHSAIIGHRRLVRAR